MQMPAKNEDLHGNVPDSSPVALLLIDVINDLEFDEGEMLLRHALPMAEALAELKSRAKKAGIPVIYVNDNFGRWQSDFNRLLQHCMYDDVLGKPIAQLLKPDEDDYFVLKPKHSGFFSSTLDTLLDYLDARTLILTGIAGNICVLFTANDAYMRDFNLVIPRDCIASNSREDNEYALQIMETVLKADTTPSRELDVESMVSDSVEQKQAATPADQTPRFARKGEAAKV
jgi:nicotinamidase-related amidase